MAILTKKEVSERSGVELKNIHNYIKRGKLILNPHGMVDTDNAVNRAFLMRHSEKVARKAKHNVNDQHNIELEYLRQDGIIDPVIKDEPAPKIFDEKGNEIPDYAQSEQKLKYLDTLKREREVQKLDIEIAKKRGEVIPSELIPPVILQHNQSIITSFKNEFEDWLRVHAKKYDMTQSDVAEVRAESVSWINRAMDKAIKASILSVEGIVKNYQEKRGIGERL